jgi:hypothetical protein
MRGVWCFLELTLLPPTYPVVPGLDIVGGLLISSPLHSTYRDWTDRQTDVQHILTDSSKCIVSTATGFDGMWL